MGSEIDGCGCGICELHEKIYLLCFNRRCRVHWAVYLNSERERIIIDVGKVYTGEVYIGKVQVRGITNTDFYIKFRFMAQ